MVRHDKKSDFIDVGEFQDFQKGNEKKVIRTNTAALISYLEESNEVIRCS